MNPPPLPAPKPPLQQPSSSLGDDLGMRLLLPVGRSGWAIAAGYLGLFSFLVIPAPISLIISLIALVDIQRSRKTARPKYGLGRSIFGLIMGILGTLILILAAVSSFIA